MADDELWRRIGPKEFLEFLSNVSGEDYDAVVYDVKYDFDPHDMAAAKYIAKLAMEKAQAFVPDASIFLYLWAAEIPKPDNGSVAPYDSYDGNDAVQSMRKERLYRTAHTANKCLYVPDAGAYSGHAIGAVRYSTIDEDELTEAEWNAMCANDRKECWKFVISEEWGIWWKLFVFVFGLTFLWLIVHCLYQNWGGVFVCLALIVGGMIGIFRFIRKEVYEYMEDGDRLRVASGRRKRYSE